MDTQNEAGYRSSNSDVILLDMEASAIRGVKVYCKIEQNNGDLFGVTKYISILIGYFLDNCINAW